VRAYSDAVREVLSVLPRAVKVPTHTVAIVMPYSLYERIRRLVTAYRGEILDEDFGAEVTVTARFSVEYLPGFQGALQEMSGGRIEAEVIETDEATIMPIEEPME
jgi:putative IMPACT (imprinted ancient) family translation regulator